MSASRKQRLKVLASRHLTTGYEPALAAMMHATVPGMAHWSGSGPSGETCGHCGHLGYWEQVRNDTGDTVYSRRRTGCCAKFFQLTGKHGAVVPVTASACRHFQPQNEATKQGRTK
jgi:hypothetical protein